jgi:hypothetical protein
MHYIRKAKATRSCYARDYPVQAYTWYCADMGLSLFVISLRDFAPKLLVETDQEHQEIIRVNPSAAM